MVAKKIIYHSIDYLILYCFVKIIFKKFNFFDPKTRFDGMAFPGKAKFEL